MNTVIELLRHLLAIELFRSGVTQEAIGKHLQIAKAKVVEMSKGVEKKK